MWETHFPVCMWVMGLSCGWLPTSLWKRGFLKADTQAPHACITKVCLSCALPRYVQTTLINIVKSLGINQSILTPVSNELGIKIKSSLSAIVPSGGGKKKKRPDLNTFPGTARTHSEIPLFLFCQVLGPERHSWDLLLEESAQLGGPAGPSLPPWPGSCHEGEAALTPFPEHGVQGPRQTFNIQASLWRAREVDTEPGARTGRHPAGGTLWTVLFISLYRGGGPPEPTGHWGTLRQHQGRQAGAVRAELGLSCQGCSWWRRNHTHPHPHI